MQTLKKCYRCQGNFPLSFFNKNNNRKDKRQSSCRKCQTKDAKVYYVNNRKQCTKVVRLNKRRRALENYISIVTRYLNKPCVDCKNVFHPASMVFDHKVGTDKDTYKTEGVSYLIRNGYSLNRIEKEIAKCDVRCQNCHFLKTSKDFNHWKEIYGLLSDYSSLIRKLYKKHRNFYQTGAFKKHMETITSKFLGYAIEKIRMETEKKREDMNNE